MGQLEDHVTWRQPTKVQNDKAVSASRLQDCFSGKPKASRFEVQLKACWLAALQRWDKKACPVLVQPWYLQLLEGAPLQRPLNVTGCIGQHFAGFTCCILRVWSKEFSHQKKRFRMCGGSAPCHRKETKQYQTAPKDIILLYSNRHYPPALPLISCHGNGSPG